MLRILTSKKKWDVKFHKNFVKIKTSTFAAKLSSDAVISLSQYYINIVLSQIILFPVFDCIEEIRQSFQGNNGIIIAARSINFSRCRPELMETLSLIPERIPLRWHFVSVRREILFSPESPFLSTFLSGYHREKMSDVHSTSAARPKAVFLWPANRMANRRARQPSQTQDIKGRLRSSTSGSAIHRIIVAVVPPDLLMHRNICFERKLSRCKMDVTRWSVCVQFRGAY